MAMRIAKGAGGAAPQPAPKPGAPSVSPRSKTAPRLQSPALSPRTKPSPVLKVEETETMVLSMPPKESPAPTPSPAAQSEGPPPLPPKSPQSRASEFGDGYSTPPPRPLPQPMPVNDAPPPPVPRPSVLPPKYQAVADPPTPMPTVILPAGLPNYPPSSRMSIAADNRMHELEDAIKGLVANQTGLEREAKMYDRPLPSFPQPSTPAAPQASNNEFSEQQLIDPQLNAATAQLKETSTLLKQTAENADKRNQSLEQSLAAITELLRQKTAMEEQARVRAEKLEDDIRSLREMHERNLLEERRKSTALLSDWQKDSESKVKKDFETKLKAAEEKAAAAEARAIVEAQRANQVQLRLDAGSATSAAAGSQVADFAVKLQRADDSLSAEQAMTKTLQARIAELETRSKREEQATLISLSGAEERIKSSETKLRQEEEKTKTLDAKLRAEEEKTRALENKLRTEEDRTAKADVGKKEAEFAAAKASEDYGRRLKELSSAMPNTATSGASESTIADITAKWRAAEEKAALFQTKIEAAMKGLKQYKVDKEKFVATEAELKKTAEKLKFLEDLVGGGPSSVSAPPTSAPSMVREAPTPTLPPAEKTPHFLPPSASMPNMRAQSPAPGRNRDTLENKLDELFAPGPVRDLRMPPPNSIAARNAVASPLRSAMASPARLRGDVALVGNLDSLEASLAELSAQQAPASAPTKAVTLTRIDSGAKKGSSRQANNDVVNQLEAQLDALSEPSHKSKSHRIPAPEKPIQLNKNAINPDYVERTMSPGPARPPKKEKTNDDDEFNPRSGAAAPLTKAQARSKRDLLIQEAEAVPFEYSNKDEDEKVTKLLALRGIAQAGGKEAALPDVSSPLKQAANAEPQPDYDKIVAILQAGKERPDPAWLNRYRQTYLHLVCIKNQAKLAKWLIDMTTPVDSKDLDGNTALHLCCTLGNIQCAEVLLTANASADLVNMAGDTPVHIAAKSGHANLIQAMLPYRPQLDSSDNNGQRVLHKAVYSGSAEVVNLLVANSAHLDPEDENFYTPLLMAEMSGKHDLADLLITLGADTKCCSKQGDSLLWASIESGNLARSERLIREHRLDVNLCCGKFRWSALHRAVMHLADINVAERTVNFLLQLGAKPDVKNNEEKTPLFFAAYRGSAPMVRALLQAGANANHTDLGQNTPLFFAKNAEVASMILDRGAKINHKNKCVHTALHVAAAFYPNNSDLINLLKSRGTDLKAKNKWGHTPLELLQIANLDKKIIIPYQLGEEALPSEMCGIMISPPGALRR